MECKSAQTSRTKCPVRHLHARLRLRQKCLVKSVRVLFGFFFLAAQILASATGCQFYPLGEYMRFIRIPEDLRIGDIVLNLEIHARQGHNLSLESVDRNTDDAKYFRLIEVDDQRVEIRVGRSLENLVDAETPQSILKFRVVCAPIGAEGAPVVQSVTIYLEDVNNHAPQFVGAPYNVTVDELTPVGLTLFRGIAALDHDKPNTANSDVYFSIVGGNEGGHFGLAPGTGAPAALTLRKRLDYDGGDQEFKLVLQATDRGREPLSSTATLYVTVLDSDDLHPIFSSSMYSTTVTEAYPFTNATIRQRVEFPSGGSRGGGPIRAYDQDASINATIEYDIVSGNELGHFEIGVTTGELYLVRQIDRENLPPTMGSAFELQIRARQSDNPTKFGLARVHVDVLDINDNLPRFEAEVYNISIMENLPNHFSIVQVYATDADVGENAEFGYKLEDASRAFAINSKTGWLTVRDQSKLDRERVDSFRLAVYAEEKVPNVASSGTGPSKRASCTISIILLDSNDNSPKFEPSNLYKFQITSGAAQIGDVIGKITAVDPDLGGNGKVSYEIQKQNASTSAFAPQPHEGLDPFQVDEKEGYIYLLEASQTLPKTQYVLLIGAYDQPLNPSERRSSLAVVQIDVVKNHGGVGHGARVIGGSRPEFVGSPYQFWVGNEVGVGTSVGQVKVRDFDPKNTVYDLLHSYYDGVPFAIEERTGIIAVVDDLLKYARHAYDFEAYVTDSRHTLTTNVSIHIVDPISSDSFESNQQNGVPRPPIELSVQENVAGAIIGNLKTILLAGGGSGIREAGGATVGATMELVLANGRDKFGVSPDGTLYTLQGLDREEPGGANYLLTVISQKRGHLGVGGGGVHAHQVHITVVDENDNPPQFDRQQYEGAVKENVNPGTPVTMETPIRVIDPDEGGNAAYRIELSGNGADRFRIDPSSGRVYVGNKNLDREERQIYHLDLTATDGLNRSARARLQIMVTDLNDNAPQFIHKIIVDPPEVDENGGPNGMRELLQHSGSSQPVSLEIASSEPILVPETIPIGSVIARVSASDRDLDDNARVFYRIVSENSNTTGSAVPYLTDKQYLFSRTKSEKHFGIDRVSGRISVIKGLKPDTSYALNISASDRGGLRSYTGIKINAYDVNNHLPTFKEHFYRYELTEGQFLNAQIGRVSATDKDSGLNGEILYTLNWKDPKDKKSSKEMLPFSINSTSGVIFAHGDIDREARSAYHLQALATDGGGPPLSASVDVEIAVLDKNESPPKFYNHVSSVIMNGVTIPVYRATLEDGAPAGSLVTRLYANDTDDPLLGNGVVLFHLTNHHKEFHIDSKNGTIFTSMKLRTSLLPGADGQKKEYNFNLSVVAQDLGRPSLSSKAFVLVRLEPLAGSAWSPSSTPGTLGRLFEQDSYSFKIPYQTHGPIPAFLAKINVTAPYRRLKTEFELAGPESVVSNFRVEGGAIYVVKRLAADTSYEFLIRGYNSGTKQKVFDTRQRVRAAVMGKIPESNEAVIRVHVEPAATATPTPPPTISFKKPIANVNVNVKPHSSPSEPPPSVSTPKSPHARTPTKTKTNTAVLNEFVSSSTNRPRPHPHPVGPSDPSSKSRGKPSSLYAGEVAIIVLSAIILLGGLVAAISVSCVRKKRGHRSRRGGAGGGPMPLEVHLQKHGAGARMVSNRPLIFPMALPAHDQIQPPPGSESTSDTYTDPGDMFVDHGHGGHGHGGHAAALGLHASGFSICPECRKLRKPSTATQTIIFDPAPRGHIIDRGPLKQVRSFGRDISLQSNNDSGIDGSDGQCNCYQSHNFSSDSSGRSLFVDQYEDSLMPPMMVAPNPKSFRRKHSSRRPSKHKSKRSSNTSNFNPGVVVL